MSQPSQEELRRAWEGAAVPRGPEPSQDELRAAWEGAETTPKKDTGKYDRSTEWGPYLLNEAKKGVAGLAALPAIPLDAVGTNIVNAARRAMGAQLLPAFYLSNAARGGAESLLGVDPMRPANIGQEIAGDITQFAVPGAPMAGFAMRGAPLAQKLSILASEAGQDILGGLGTTAGRNVGGELGAAAGGFAGGLSASVVPAVTRKAYDVGRQFVTKEGNTAWQYGRAGKELESALQSHIGSGGELARSTKTVANVKRLGGEDYNPSLQARSGSSAVGTLEHAVNASTPERLERAMQNFDDSMKALNTAKERAFPSAVTRESYVSAAQKRVALAEKSIDDVLSAITKERERLAASVTGETAQKAGSRIESLVEQQYKVMRGVRDQKYADVYKIADKTGEKMDMSDVLALAEKLKKDHPNVFQDMPATFKDVVARYSSKNTELTGRSIDPDLMAAAGIGAAKDTNVPFSEFHSLWKELGRDANAASQAGRPEIAKFANDVRDLMGSKLQLAQERPTELGKAFKDANTWFNTKFAPAFREGTGGQIVTPGRWGERIAQEKIMDRFFTPSGMDDFSSVFGSNPQANQARHQAILGLFSKDADVIKNGGVMGKNAGLVFYEKHKEALDKIPRTREVILDVARRNDELIANAQRASQEVGKADRALFSQVVKAGDPDAVIGKLMAEGKFDDIGRLMSGDQRHKEATARIVADNMQVAAERLGITPEQYVLRFGDKLRPLMDQLGSGHFRNLKVIANGETLLGRQASTPSQANIQADTTAESLSRLATTTRNIGMRHSSEAWLAQSFLFRWWGKMTKERRLEALHKASLDPEFADSLAKAFRMKETPSLISEIQSNFARLGLKIAATQEGPEKE